MNWTELLTDARSIVTLVSLLTFLGIVWWAYSGRRTAAFTDAAHLPFADDEAGRKAGAKVISTENDHG
jgi:cytochrome c oxidase cbb3-type subunit 4